jgi:hypothetical protein
MDKLINKVKKDLDKGEKDTKVLLKADKKFDKTILIWRLNIIIM